MWVEVIFSLCVWVEDSEPGFPIVLLSPVHRSPHQAEDCAGPRKPGPAPRVAFAVTPLPHGKSIQFLACETILRGSGWDLYFLLPLPKGLAAFWHGDKMQPPPSANTIKPPPDQTSFGARIEQLYGTRSRLMLRDYMRCPRSPETL